MCVTLVLLWLLTRAGNASTAAADYPGEPRGRVAISQGGYPKDRCSTLPVAEYSSGPGTALRRGIHRVDALCLGRAQDGPSALPRP